MTKSNFTLQELVIIIFCAVVLILLGTNCLVFAKSDASESVCRNNMHRIGTAFSSYFDQYNGRIIVQAPNETVTYMSALRDSKMLKMRDEVFRCPNNLPEKNVAEEVQSRLYCYGMNVSLLQGHSQIKTMENQDNFVTLIANKMERPADFLMIADARTTDPDNPKTSRYNLSNRGENGWSSLPWAVHDKERVMTAWADGHVALSSRSDLYFKWIEDNHLGWLKYMDWVY